MAQTDPPKTARLKWEGLPTVKEKSEPDINREMLWNIYPPSHEKRSRNSHTQRIFRAKKGRNSGCFIQKVCRQL